MLRSIEVFFRTDCTNSGEVVQSVLKKKRKDLQKGRF